MNLFALTSESTINKAKAGRKTAALRVRQRQKRESLRWSPSGKLRTPHSQRSPTIRNRIPWNDRFIFDDENHPKGAIHPMRSRVVSRRACDEKENDANSNSSSNRIRNYTERSDGVEISTYSGAAGRVSEGPSAVETRSIALSPFNMAKVKAALRRERLSEPKSLNEVKSILDEFEELILTMEIEEELVRRDLELEWMKVKTKTETSCNDESLQHKEDNRRKICL